MESGLLSLQELATAQALCAAADVDFIKTSTGYAAIGAELEKVRALHGRLSGQMRIKASGGIRTVAQALAFLAAGADRIGTSALLVAGAPEEPVGY